MSDTFFGTLVTGRSKLDPTLTLASVVAFCALMVVIATALAIANRYFAVADDPRVESVSQMLPQTNCGACGYPGCRAFAEAVVAGRAEVAACTVSTTDSLTRISEFLGVEMGTRRRRVARLACAGGDNVARNRAHYQGHPSCAAASLVAGGGKACFYGCLGLGDCVDACHFDAIRLDGHRLPVVDEQRCTACGDCVVACPKDLFSLHDVNDRLWVACSSLAQGDQLVEDCQVACTGCGRCAADAPDQIVMQGGLPVIDYCNTPLSAAPTQRCPTGAIVWLDRNAGMVKGRSAAKIIRRDAMPDAET